MLLHLLLYYDIVISKGQDGKPLKTNNKDKLYLPRLEQRCESVASLLKALAHPRRLLIMGHLIAGEKTVGELQELCGVSQSQLSQFLTRMRLEKLVACERRGRFQYYSAADERVAELIRSLQKIYC